MTRSIQVRAPCRLHFGLFSFGRTGRQQFGGVGVMIDPPAVQVTFRPAERFTASGVLADRVRHFIEVSVQSCKLPTMPACEIAVDSPPDHIGLGVGTQLGLALAAGLRRFFSLPELPIHELASSVGRGTRSAVGTHGFRHGGLIVDAGKEPGQALGRLAERVSLPAEWRIVLVRSIDEHGLAGDFEAAAFDRLPPVPDEVTQELWRITQAEMLPAIRSADCGAFGDAVYCFGRLAGECFAAVQGGPFASPATARLVKSIRHLGVPGVGQSSWGPTVFAITANDSQSDELCRRLRSLDVPASAITIARPANRGAQLSRL